MKTDSGVPLIASRRFLLWFTAVHALASAACSVTSFGLGMGRLDTGSPPSLFERVLEGLSLLLLSPLFTAFERSELARLALPGLLGWLLVIANSLLWALGTWFVIAGLRRIGSPASG